jgi:hypothetical protein
LIILLAQVVGLEDVRTADINAGGWHSLALTTEGGAALLPIRALLTEMPA